MTQKTVPTWNNKIDFSKLDGLLPAIIIDDNSGKVLMLGFMNPDTYQKTIETGFVHYWSRTRQKVWMKGETSGHTQKVISITPDCDYDTLLIRVIQKGVVCHTQKPTCFFEESWKP